MQRQLGKTSSRKRYRGSTDLHKRGSSAAFDIERQIRFIQRDVFDDALFRIVVRGEVL